MKTNDFINSEKSTFQTAQKDLFGVITKLINNEPLKKLLYYSSKDALTKPNLTEEETFGLLHKNIKVVPELSIEEDINSYILVSFDNFTTNANNPQFRDNIITFDIICHMDTWVMENYQLRPYLIMGAIDGMMNNKKLNGIGTIDFISANQLLLSGELAGFTLMYRVINDV